MPLHETATPGAIALRDTRVADAMSAPPVTCAPDVPLAEVARLMVEHRIHALLVLLPGDDGTDWAVLSDTDLLAAAPFDESGTTAGRVAATPPVVVEAEASLLHAAGLMADNATSHLVVVDDRGAPAGVVSALDIAAALAPRPPAPEEPPVRAAAGERLVVSGHRLGERPRDAEILETRGRGGGPPYLVRWSDDGRVSLLYPGSDAHIEPARR